MTTFQKVHAVVFYILLVVSAVATLAMAFMPMGKGGSMHMSMGADQSMHMNQ